MAKKQYRPDRDGAHRKTFDKNKKIILATQNICGICGRPVDTSIKDTYDPLAPVVDHIIPVSKGGHPSDLQNLQLAHRICNRIKSNKIIMDGAIGEEEVVDNRTLPLSMDWKAYRAP